MEKAREATLPQDIVEQLDLHDGEHVRLEGVVQGKEIVLRVVESQSVRENAGAGVGFADRWRGKFKDVVDMDHSDDPRAQYLLEHH